MEELLCVLAVPSFIAMLAIYTVVAGLYERRNAQPYAVPEPGEEYAETAYAKRANDVAEALGFTHEGFAHHAKWYFRVRYDYWRSPNGETVAMVGGGKTATVPLAVRNVRLFSRRTDGLAVLTTDEVGDQEISGVVLYSVWPNYTFDQLCERHAAQLAKSAAVPFAKGEAIRGVLEIHRLGIDAMVARGWAYYHDLGESTWSFTFAGAVRFYVLGVWVRPIRRLLRSVGIVRD